MMKINWKAWFVAGIVWLLLLAYGAAWAETDRYRLHISGIPDEAYGYRIIAVIGSWDDITTQMNRLCPTAAGANLTSEHYKVDDKACGPIRKIFILECFRYVEKKS